MRCARGAISASPTAFAGAAGLGLETDFAGRAGAGFFAVAFLGAGFAALVVFLVFFAATLASLSLPQRPTESPLIGFRIPAALVLLDRTDPVVP
jgi:hypothetical protein